MYFVASSCQETVLPLSTTLGSASFYWCFWAALLHCSLPAELTVRRVWQSFEIRICVSPQCLQMSLLRMVNIITWAVLTVAARKLPHPLGRERKSSTTHSLWPTPHTRNWHLSLQAPATRTRHLEEFHFFPFFCKQNRTNLTSLLAFKHFSY